jgi:hypothetical protein
MGVGKSMKIFTEAMENSMSNFGYGSKVVTTMMGPFQWNDTLEMWVNVNNGFMLPNISMQDMLAFGYGDDAGAVDGGVDKPAGVQICYENITSTTGLILTLKPNDGYQSLIPLYTPANPVEGCFGQFYVFAGFSETPTQLGVDLEITIDGTNYTTLNYTTTLAVPPALPSSTVYTVPRSSWGTAIQLRVRPNSTTTSNGVWPVGTTGIARGLRLYNLDNTQIMLTRFSTTN